VSNEAEGIAEVIHHVLKKLPGFEITEVMENALSGLGSEEDQGFMIDVETNGRLYHVLIQPSVLE